MESFNSRNNQNEKRELNIPNNSHQEHHRNKQIQPLYRKEIHPKPFVTPVTAEQLTKIHNSYENTVVCPNNPQHIVQNSRLASHLLKCTFGKSSQNNKEVLIHLEASRQEKQDKQRVNVQDELLKEDAVKQYRREQNKQKRDEKRNKNKVPDIKEEEPAEFEIDEVEAEDTKISKEKPSTNTVLHKKITMQWLEKEDMTLRKNRSSSLSSSPSYSDSEEDNENQKALVNKYRKIVGDESFDDDKENLDSLNDEDEEQKHQEGSDSSEIISQTEYASDSEEDDICGIGMKKIKEQYVDEEDEETEIIVEESTDVQMQIEESKLKKEMNSGSNVQPSLKRKNKLQKPKYVHRHVQEHNLTESQIDDLPKIQMELDEVNKEKFTSNPSRGNRIIETESKEKKSGNRFPSQVSDRKRPQNKRNNRFLDQGKNDQSQSQQHQEEQQQKPEGKEIKPLGNKLERNKAFSDNDSQSESYALQCVPCENLR